MTLSLKLLWGEGLGLEAQHLQRLDCYHESRLRHMASAIQPLSWGVQLARWNVEAVRSNLLRAQTLSLIFEDGEIYEAPHSDDLPLAVDLGKLPADASSVVFYAALPVVKAHGGNLASNDIERKDMRYAPCNERMPDLYTDAFNTNIAYMKKTLRLLSQFEGRDAFDCIPVVRLCRTGDGSFEIDPTYIPPSLTVVAAPALNEMLSSLLAKLTAKAEALFRLQRQSKQHTIEARSGDVSFWMLSTINSASAALTHSAQSGHCHPEQLFGQLMALAGGLMTFSSKYTLADFPRYDHENPTPGFDALNAIICDLLDIAISTKYNAIPLVLENVVYHTGKLNPTLTDAKARLYLAVSANMPAATVIGQVLRQLKLGAPEDVRKMVLAALAGLPLEHLAQVPMALPVRPDVHYFSIANQGPLHEAMVKAQAITIYAPTTFTDLKVELFAVID